MTTREELTHKLYGIATFQLYLNDGSQGSYLSIAELDFDKVVDLIDQQRQEARREFGENLKGVVKVLQDPITHHPPRCLMENDIDTLLTSYDQPQEGK